MRRVSDDELLHLVSDGQDLVDAEAVVVAGVAAEVAADTRDEVILLGGPATPLEERPLVGSRGVGLGAVLADPAHEPLPDHAEQRRRDEEGLDAHVHETVQCRRRVGGLPGS